MPIDAYGNGGFRFGDMSHRGSILCLPSGVHAWTPGGTDAGMVGEITAEMLAAVFAEASGIGVLLLGTGTKQVFASKALRQAFEAAGIGLEVMATGAAARTYNVLLAEGRRVATALICVD